MIKSSPSLATPEHLGEIECTMFPHINRTSDGSLASNSSPASWRDRLPLSDARRRKPRTQQQTARSVSFRKADGLVHFAEAGSRFWLGGREVEAWECR